MELSANLPAISTYIYRRRMYLQIQHLQKTGGSTFPQSLTAARLHRERNLCSPPCFSVSSMVKSFFRRGKVLSHRWRPMSAQSLIFDRFFPPSRLPAPNRRLWARIKLLTVRVRSASRLRCSIRL